MTSPFVTVLEHSPLVGESQASGLRVV
jgi:hypothetical protein